MCVAPGSGRMFWSVLINNILGRREAGAGTADWEGTGRRFGGAGGRPLTLLTSLFESCGGWRGFQPPEFVSCLGLYLLEALGQAWSFQKASWVPRW